MKKMLFALLIVGAFSCKKESGECFADYYKDGIVIESIPMADYTAKSIKCTKRPELYDSVVGRCEN